MPFLKNLKAIAWNSQFSPELTCGEKEKLNNELCNVIVDKNRYEKVMHFKNDNAAIKNMRKNVIQVFVRVTKTWFQTWKLFCQIHLMNIFFLRLST